MTCTVAFYFTMKKRIIISKRYKTCLRQFGEDTQISIEFTWALSLSNETLKIKFSYHAQLFAETLKSWTKYLESFSRFDTVSLDHRWNGTKSYHQKLNARVASQVTRRLNTWDLRELGNFKKISKLFWVKGECTTSHSKLKLRQLVKKMQSISSKTFQRKIWFIHFCEFVHNILSWISGCFGHLSYLKFYNVLYNLQFYSVSNNFPEWLQKHQTFFIVRSVKTRKPSATWNIFMKALNHFK